MTRLEPKPGQLWTVLADNGVSKNFIIINVGPNTVTGIRVREYGTCVSQEDTFSYETILKKTLVRLEGEYCNHEVALLIESINNILELL